MECFQMKFSICVLTSLNTQFSGLSRVNEVKIIVFRSFLALHPKGERKGVELIIEDEILTSILHT